MKLKNQELLLRVKQGLPPAALLYGEEQGLIDQSVAALWRAGLEGQEPDDFDTETFHGGDLDPERFLSSCRSFPFLLPRRLVQLREGDALSPPGKRVVLEYLEKPSPTTLLLVSAANLEARDPLRKGFEGHQQAWAVPFYPLEGAALINWIQLQLREQGFQPQRDALEALGQLLAGDTRIALMELEKLMLFMGRERRITQEDVLAMVGETASHNPFALASAATGGDPREALHILGRLSEGKEHHPIALLGVITRRLRQLARGREMLDRGAAPADITGKLRIFWKERDLFIAQCRRWTPQRLAQGLLAALEADAGLKGGDAPGEQVMGTFILRLGELAGPPTGTMARRW